MQQIDHILSLLMRKGPKALKSCLLNSHLGRRSVSHRSTIPDRITAVNPSKLLTPTTTKPGKPHTPNKHPTSNPPDKLMGMQMSIIEAAVTLGVSTNTIRRRLTSGLLTGKKTGNKWLINVEDDLENPSRFNGGSAKGREHQFPPTPDALLEVLQGEIMTLKEQLEARTREIGELHQLLGAKALNPAPHRWWQFWRQ